MKYNRQTTSLKNEQMKKELTKQNKQDLLNILRRRFEENMIKHKNMEWAKLQARLEAELEKLWSLNEMEATGGEPDLVDFDKKTGEYIFIDCSKESPAGRRNLCYDVSLRANASFLIHQLRRPLLMPDVRQQLIHLILWMCW